MTATQKHSRLTGVLVKTAGLLLVAGTLVLGWLALEYRAFTNTPLSVPAKGLELHINPGASLHRISKDLAAQRILEYPRFLTLLGRQTGLASRIQAGEYHIDPGTTPAQLLDQLSSGKVIQHGLTLVEGWTFAQMRQAVADHPALNHTLGNLSDTEIMEKIGHAGEHPEGRFLPDTYLFPRGTSDIEFLKRAYDAMSSVLASEWDIRSADLPLDSPYESLILASIIERETAQPDERDLIAGVFIRRLEKNMRLQTDPTVIYGIGPAFDGNIRKRDLRTDTPYNTYTRSGLPPTPIAMPGAASIHAALHPAGGDALYFVARGDGSHEFSSTIEAHNKAVRKYQLGK